MHFCKGKVRLLMVAVVFNFDDEFGAVFRPGRCCLACMDRGLGLLRKIEDLVLFGAFPRTFAVLLFSLLGEFVLANDLFVVFFLALW